MYMVNQSNPLPFCDITWLGYEGKHERDRGTVNIGLLATA